MAPADASWIGTVPWMTATVIECADGSVHIVAGVTAVGIGVNMLNKGNGGGNNRGVWWQWWRGDSNWKGAVKQVKNGWTIKDVNWQIPTIEEATDLINEAGGTVLRVDPPHEAPNPHDFPHINYTMPKTPGSLKWIDGTIQIAP